MWIEKFAGELIVGGTAWLFYRVEKMLRRVGVMEVKLESHSEASAASSQQIKDDLDGHRQEFREHVLVERQEHGKIHERIDKLFTEPKGGTEE